MTKNKKSVIIIGGGPAGLTAAYELLEKSEDFTPYVFEESTLFGGISRTEEFKGNRIDIGGHRFFSKSDIVMDWWQKILPIYNSEGDKSVPLFYHNKTNVLEIKNTKETEEVFLIRKRKSRIFFLGKFFDYPISLNKNTIFNLGFKNMVIILFSYLKAKTWKRKENNFEDFCINRFGFRLYDMFFKDYTEKVWGVPCSQMTTLWGKQRIKGLSLSKIIVSYFKKIFVSRKDIKQKKIETSLIEYFLYPRLGPGQLWEFVAKKIKEKGGEIINNHKVIGIESDTNKVSSVTIFNKETKEEKKVLGDFFISTMPIKELTSIWRGPMDEKVKDIGNGLNYRDFITVGILTAKKNPKLEDTWIYVQEKNLKVGRMQIFNNWSPAMVKDSNHTWIGLEYFCNEGDALWELSDGEFMNLAKAEFLSMGFFDESDIIDTTIIRQKKAYPAYTGTYNSFKIIRDFFDSVDNLFLVGRNGMHKYNNQDHSMLTAMAAVRKIIKNERDKEEIWNINTEEEYHEQK